MLLPLLRVQCARLSRELDETQLLLAAATGRVDQLRSSSAAADAERAEQSAKLMKRMLAMQAETRKVPSPAAHARRVAPCNTDSCGAMPGAEAAAAYGAGAPAHDVGPLVRALNIHQCAVQPSGSTGPLLQRRGRVQP
jgi:hypothetical protein